MTQTNILVTGSDGFIGKSLVDYFNIPSVRDELNIGNVTTLDIGDYDLSDCTIQGNVELLKDVDVIYHFAGSVGVSSWNERSNYCFFNNSLINENIKSLIMNATLEYKKDYFIVFASTSEVYGCTLCAKEDESIYQILPSPRGMYALEKLHFEHILNMYDIPNCCVRLFNIIGSTQKIANGVVPKMINQILKGEEVTIEPGSRAYMGIDDCVKALGLILQHRTELNHCALNIGNPNNKITNENLYHLICNIMGQSATKVYYANTAQILDRCPDISRMKNILHFSPSEDLETIIKKIVKDMRRF